MRKKTDLENKLLIELDVEAIGSGIILHIPFNSKKTSGGIVIPDTAVKNAATDYFKSNNFNLVLSVGKQVEGLQEIKKGDYVAIDTFQVNLNEMFSTPAFPNENFLFVHFSAVKMKLK